MKIISKIFFISTFLLAGNMVAQASGSPKITNYVASGNLESTNEIGCVKSTELSNKNTPADLYRGLTVCLNKDNYKDGAFLFALAGVYGRFDTFRVKDKSAHQAVTVLQMNTLGALDKAKSESLKTEIKKMLNVPKKLRVTCNEIKKIGSPSYYPRYMIQHGMKAFTGGGSKNGLNDNFDSTTAWGKALDNYLHCPNN